jgi:hypothetical protein
MGQGAHVIGWVALVRIGGDFLWRFGARAKESALKRDSRCEEQLCFRFSPTRYAPLPSKSLLYAAVVALALLVHLKRFQTEWVLDMMRRLPVWSAPACGGRIRVGAFPLGDLAAEELMLFVSCVMALPISSSSCCCWRSATSRGWRSSASAQFQGCSSALRWWKASWVAAFRQCSASRMFISLAVVESELGCGSVLRMSWWPASMNWSSPATPQRLDRKHRLPPCFQLFSFNGLVVTPVGRWRRGPLHFGARVEVATAAGKPPGRIP